MGFRRSGKPRPHCVWGIAEEPSIKGFEWSLARRISLKQRTIYDMLNNDRNSCGN
ncbi:MAG: hypothetical protein JNL64_01955 [Blastocatellia bacterium]|nr:hypothetical protein [Blastocatellia bacterium]